MWGLTSAVTIVFSHFASEVYRSKGNPKISFLSQLIHLAFLVPTLIISVGYGFEVLYISRSLIRIQGIIVGLLIMHFMYKFKIWTVFGNVLPMIISALIMGVAGYFLESISVAVIWQICAVLICIIVYFAALLLLFPRVRKEIFALDAVRKIKRKVLKRK